MYVFGRLLLFCLLAVAIVYTPFSLPSESAHAAVPAVDEDKDESGQGNGEGNEDDDKDKGDKDDEDERKDDKDEDDGDDGDGNGNGNGKGKGQVEPAEPYSVEVTCEAGPEEGQTTCTFTGQAPEGAKDVGHVDLPESEVCAPVVSGDAEYVDPDPNTRVVGYKSRGSEGRFTLVLDGEVTSKGSATYWFKTGDGVFPARGPGLNCEGEANVAETGDQPAPTESPLTLELTPLPTGTAAAPTATQVSGPTDSTGVVLVESYACPFETAETAVDWFGSCEPGAVDLEFRLVLDGDEATAMTASTDDQGRVWFAGLGPGTYDLTQVNGAWCHAESDGVDANGKLVVSAGEQVTVWIFTCGGTAPK